MRLLLPLSICILFRQEADGSDDEERLMSDLFRGYNNLIQPVRHINETPTIVKVALQLALLINVDEKEQIMHTNVWLTLMWHDFQMKWNPVNYGEIKQIRVSPDKVWLPDLVLFNNADGNFEVSFMCNVVIGYQGNMLWVPPAIYKSSCIIDVEFFPFDEQVCTLVFGSWTYNESEIKLEFANAELIDLAEYVASSIWDLIDAPASLVNKRSQIEFQIRIRRKTLFYTVVLIIPTVLMSFLSMSVLFLPTDSTEKITLTISVLLSIVVFLLLVSKILPPTSSTIPLMAKYLLLTFVLNVITILVTVIIINIYHRGPTTHRMPRWVRTVFIETLPRLMCMKSPKSASRKLQQARAKKTFTQLPGLGAFALNQSGHHPLCPSHETKLKNGVAPAAEIVRDPTTAAFYPLSADAIKALDAIEYITEYLKEEEEYKIVGLNHENSAVGSETQALEKAPRRLEVCGNHIGQVFFAVTLGGTCGILLSAPNVFNQIDQAKVLDHLRAVYKNGGAAATE